MDGLAGDVARALRQQEGDGRRDLLRLAGAARRRFLDRGVPYRIGQDTGQALGRMTESGEPELYLEARRNGEPVDPGGWVRQAR